MIEATPANLATLEQIKKKADSAVKYMSDMEQWGKPQRWDAGETGFGDCEDIATFALMRCMEAGFPREACLITYAIDQENGWHFF